jgi:hypothetical protein
MSPSASPKLPIAHGVHDVRPVVAANVPIPHGEQLVALPAAWK